MTEREPVVPMKIPCPQCGGAGRLPWVPPTGGQIVGGDATKSCPRCGEYGLIPQDVPLSEFRKLLDGSH